MASVARFRRAAYVWALMLAILLLAPLPGFGGGRGGWTFIVVPHMDKIVHVALFVVMGWLVGRAIAPSGEVLTPWLLAAAASTTYGLALEGAQSFLPWRTADLLDALANGFGASLGGGLVVLRVRRDRPAQALR